MHVETNEQGNVFLELEKHSSEASDDRDLTMKGG